mgnify:CR=1 FL=1
MSPRPPASSCPLLSPLGIDLIFATPQWGKSRLSARRRIRTVLDTAWETISKRTKLPKNLSPVVTVTLTDDAAIQILNRDYRHKDKATNVLSFPMWNSLDEIPADVGETPLGDIIIAFETIAREAKEQDKTLADHFSHMLVHGFLHLLGYDHIDDPDAVIMEALEINILKKLAIANPYNDDTGL